MIPRQTVILVVDDFESMRQIIANDLKTFGFSHILKARDGAEALKILKERPIDLVLSDWEMPVMNGLELLKEVRSDEELSRLPFIMITAEAKREEIEDAIYSGVSDLILKPYTAADLYERMNRALQPHNIEAISRRLRASARAREQAQASWQAQIELAASKSARASRPTILLVDDTPETLHLLVGLFDDDYQLRVANSGEKALEIIHSERQPDLVLLDIMMPGIDGFTVFKRMREHPNSEHIPVIFVTALTEEAAFLKGLQLGAIDFVTKPIDPDVLRLRVRNFMRYVDLYRRLQDDYDLMMEKAKLQDEVEQIVHHDAKAPLEGMLGVLQKMASDRTLNGSQLGQLRVVEEAALQAMNMINLSSELFKIETGRFQLHPRPIMIGVILQRIAEIARAVYAAKRIAIELETNVREGEEGIEIQGDAMLCYSLFHNLIQNACEAAPEDSIIKIKYLDEDPLRIRIRNPGTVPVHIRKRFFEKYATHRPEGEGGVGTYTAKLLVEAQHGKIEMATSDSKNQTDITVTLPRHRYPIEPE